MTSRLTRRLKLLACMLLLFQLSHSFVFFKSKNNTKSTTSNKCQNDKTNNGNCNMPPTKPTHPTTVGSKKSSSPMHESTTKTTIDKSSSSSGPIHRAISHFFHKSKSSSGKSKNGSTNKNYYSISAIYSFFTKVYQQGPVIVLAREAVKQLEQEWHWKWFIKFMFETKLDEDTLVDIISATCNLIYCLTIIIAFFFLPRNMVALLGIITAPIGPLVAFLVLTTTLILLTLLCTYPGWCIIILCVYMFLVGKLGQAIMIRLGFDIDGDGDVDVLDVLKLLANVVGGEKNILGWILIHMHHFLNDTLKDELRDIKLDLLALKMKFNIATVEEIDKYNSLIQKQSQQQHKEQQQQPILVTGATKRVTSIPKLPLTETSSATATVTSNILGHEVEHINQHSQHLSNGNTNVIYEHNGQHYIITPYDPQLHLHHNQHIYYSQPHHSPTSLPHHQQQHYEYTADTGTSGAVTPVKREGSSPSKAMSQVKNLPTLLSDSQQSTGRLNDSGHTARTAQHHTAATSSSTSNPPTTTPPKPSTALT